MSLDAQSFVCGDPWVTLLSFSSRAITTPAPIEISDLCVTIPNLEFSAPDMRAMADEVVARSIDHIASLATQPVCGDVDAAELSGP